MHVNIKLKICSHTRFGGEKKINKARKLQIARSHAQNCSGIYQANINMKNYAN
jgi:hypothetical protein